jgi:hypothetical protein
MRPRKLTDKRQLRLNFQPAEHRVHGGSGTFGLAQLAETIQAEDRLRLLEPTSLPKILRGWSPRPQTAIIARAAQRKYERRVTQDEVIGKFLGQHAAKLRQLAKRLGA